MADYTPNPNVYHPVIAIPDDGSNHDAAAWAMAYEQLADNAAHVQRYEGGWYVFNWLAPVMIPGEFYENESVAAAVVPSAAAGGVPILCAVGADGRTRRVTSSSGGSLSDAVAAMAQPTSTIVDIAGGIYDGAPTLVAREFSGELHQSDDLGMTWAAAGVIAGGFSDAVLGYFATGERWISADNTTERFRYSDDLVTWTAATGATGAPATPRKIECNATAAIAVFSGAATVCARSLDGAAWTLPTLSAGGHNWRGVAFNAARVLWMAVATDGVGAVSEDNGSSWVEIAIPTGARDVVAFDHWFVVVCTNVHGGAGASVAVSSDDGATWSEFVIDSDALATAYDRLLVFGRQIAAVGRDSIDRLRVAFSLRAPT